MNFVPLRRLAEINPPCPEFDQLPPDASVSFLPLETVWSDERADQSRRRAKSEVLMGYSRFQRGDVVCPKVTPTFQAGRSMIAAGVGAGTTELHVLRARPGVDPRWINYAVRSKHFLVEGVTAFEGVAGLQRVPPEFVQEFRVLDVGHSQQRRIADFLDDRVARIDQIIAARDEQARDAREADLEHARVLTTVGIDEKARSTSIDWMPKMGFDHQLWRIGQAFTTGSGTTPRSDRVDFYGGDVPWATTSDLRDTITVQPPRSVTAAALAEHSALVIYPAGTLLVAMYGATAGRTGILSVPATVNQACCALQTRGVIEPGYAFYWLQAHRSHIMLLASGGGQPNISQDIVRSLRIPAPTPALQAEIVRRVSASADATTATIYALARSSQLLAEYKQSLITAAVTGELDVTTAGSGIPG